MYSCVVFAQAALYLLGGCPSSYCLPQVRDDCPSFEKVSLGSASLKIEDSLNKGSAIGSGGGRL